MSRRSLIPAAKLAIQLTPLKAQTMLIRLLAAFIVIPLVELYLLLRLADATSVMTTFLVVLGTGIVGSMLARREGSLAWFRFRAALADNRMPSREIQDGLMVVFAAALLLTPGLITDAMGFLLLVPAGRDFVRNYVLSRYMSKVHVHVTGLDSGDSIPQVGDPPALEPLHRRGYTVDADHFERRR